MQAKASASPQTPNFCKFEQNNTPPHSFETQFSGSTFTSEMSSNHPNTAIEERISVNKSGNAASDKYKNDDNKDGIRLAEVGDWDKLLSLLKEHPEVARQVDQHGMLPLHWACTEDHISPQILRHLLIAYPEASIIRNKAHYLPIHIAVRSDITEESLQILCQARPSALLEETTSGKTAFMLGREANLAPHLLNLLWNAEQDCANSSMTDGVDDIKRTKKSAIEQIESLRGGFPANSKLAPLSTPSGVATRVHAKTSLDVTEESSVDDVLNRITFSGPSSQPVALGDNVRPSSCQLCYRKFGLFRRRYRCSRCLTMICHKHVAGKLQVPNRNKKRVYCQQCFGKDRIESLFTHTDKSETMALIPIRRSSLGDAIGDSAKGAHHTLTSRHITSMCSVDNLSTTTTESVEISVLHHQIGLLEERNEKLITRVADQAKHYDKAMDLLAKMMTRVKQLESQVSQNPEHHSQHSRMQIM